MNWNQVSQIAEIIEPVVIIVSLIYVAFQVRQNTTAVRATSAQAQVEGYAAVVHDITGTSTNARIWRKGLSGLKALTQHESVIFFAQATLYFRLVETAYYQNKSGVLQDELWVGIKRHCQNFASQKGMREYLKSRSYALSEEFVAFLERAPKAARGWSGPYPGLPSGG